MFENPRRGRQANFTTNVPKILDLKSSSDPNGYFWVPLICICSVILGELDAFRNYVGFSNILPKILDAIQRSMKMKILLILLSITFLNPKILGFLFSAKNSLT